MLTDRRTVDLRAICKTISQRSTFNAADVVGVVQSLIELVPELLQDGYNVKLDGLGVFSLHVSGVGKELPEEVPKRDITSVKMTFLPNKNIKAKLKLAKFEKVGG